MKASEVIAIAAAEIGYIGHKTNAKLDEPTANPGGKYTKYARDLYEAGYYNGNKNGYAWCCTFKDWCFWIAAGRDKDKANAVCPTGVYGAGVKWSQMYMDKAGLISDKPAAGAVVFYVDSTGEYSHTGIVVAHDYDTITTIEGNWSNSVSTRTIKRDDSRIKCYGIPVYEPEEATITLPDSEYRKLLAAANAFRTIKELLTGDTYGNIS